MTGPQKAALKQARQEAGDKADAEGLQRAVIDRSWTLAECEAFRLNGTWSYRLSAPKLKKGYSGIAAQPFSYDTALADMIIPSIFSPGAAPGAQLDQPPEVEAVEDREPHPLNLPPAISAAGTLEAVDQDAPPWVEDTPAGLQDHAPVSQRESTREPLPAMKPHGKQKDVLSNGRSLKGVPKFENWFGRVYPSDVTYPAWRFLTKTATDVANICRAKRDHAAAMMKKDSTGVPVFDFTVAEAEKTFKITRPTFSKAIELLVTVGFLERARCGGMPDGVGVKALYRLSEGWKTWDPPARDNANIIKARAARKQIAR